MSPLVFLDNTVLTNFALVGRVDLVLETWPEAACTTPDVMREFQAGARAGKFSAEAWAKLLIVEPTKEEAALGAFGHRRTLLSGCGSPP